MFDNDLDLSYKFYYELNYFSKNLLENCILSGIESMVNTNQLSSQEEIQIIRIFNSLRRLQPDMPNIMSIPIEDLKSVIC